MVKNSTSKNWNQSVINVSTISTFEDTLSFELTVEDKYNSDIDTVNVFYRHYEPLVLLTSSSSANEGTSMAKISLGSLQSLGKKHLYMLKHTIVLLQEMVKTIQI